MVRSLRKVVDAALQHRLDRRADVLFYGAGGPGSHRADDGGVFAAGRGDHACEPGDGLGHGDGVQAGPGEPGGGVVEGGGGQGLQ
jgi:hypothetical protein